MIETALIIAYIVKGMCGFANTLVFSTILSFTTNNINITPVELLVGYPSNIYIAWKERKSLEKEIYLPLSLLLIIGIIPGTLFLKNGNSDSVKTLFGFVVVLIGLQMLLQKKAASKNHSSKLILIVIGIISGVISGLFGIGALLAAYVSKTTDTQSQFKANMCFVFFIENTFRIILYFLTGIINITILKNAVFLMPYMILGLAFGRFLSSKAGENIIKRLVIILLICSGLSLIFIH